MCGIAGICPLGTGRRVHDADDLRRMLSMVHYRGPDEMGLYLDDGIALGQVRLSIIDLAGGTQPIHNEDRTVWIVYNGELFNYLELREDLEVRGHRFYTKSDTEVIVHLYEQYGPDCLDRMNGEFAFAIWDSREGSLFMARDRLGIRPLHYAVCEGRLLFGSEIKSILVHEEVPRRLDPEALHQIFTFWAPLSPATAFEGIVEVPAGHYLRCRSGDIQVRRYWSIPLYDRGDLLDAPAEALAEQVRETLLDAVRIRLRADVPVGSYLSGGLDSSILTSLIVRNFNNRVRTFGITFEEARFNEAAYQNEMVQFLGCSHSEVLATNRGIGDRLARVLWHCEQPLLRTSPVPLFDLSGLVRDSGFKVVLSGEGADEVFGGYDQFKETKIRRFWASQPGSRRRADLIGRLYPYIFDDPRQRRAVQAFFGRGLDRVDDPLFSHLLRWSNTRRVEQFFSQDFLSTLDGRDPVERVRAALPANFGRTDWLSRAQYLEMTIFLSRYLLSSQGDRMAMAHSVETRLPYLDYRVVDLMARVSARHKIAGLTEKWLLRKAFADILPKSIGQRPKHPYRAPIQQGLLHASHRDMVQDLLGHEAVARTGLFDAAKVQRLLDRLTRTDSPSETDNMALVGILSTQSLYRQFIQDFPKANPMPHCPQQVTDLRSRVRAAC